MATFLANDRRGSPPSSERNGGKYRTKLKVSSTPPMFELDRIELLEGSGQWENIQDVLRSAVAGLLDMQAAHQARLQAYDKELRQVQALLIKNTRDLESETKAFREHNARAAVAATEDASAFAKLRSDISSAKDIARLDAIDLTARLEGKASKELLKASLESKANQGELVELRGRIGRLSSEAGATKIRGRQALHERAIALEKRIVEVEARMRGCEALVVRADPSAINLKMNGVLSDLRDIGKRLDGKADAAKVERALEEKIDEAALNASLTSKSDHADLSKAAAALNDRTNRQDEVLVRLSRAVVDAKEWRGRVCETGLRKAEGRLESLERGMRVVAAAADGASERAERASRAVERCKKRDVERVDSKTRAVADAVRSIAKRVEDWEPSRRIAEIKQLIDLRGCEVNDHTTKVSALEDKQATRVSALSERISMLERGYRVEEPSTLPVDSVGIASRKGTDERKYAMASSPDSGSRDDSNYSPSEVAPCDGGPRGRRLQEKPRGNLGSLQDDDHEVGTNSESGLVTSPPSKASRSIPKPRLQSRGQIRGSTPDALPVERYGCSLGARKHGKQVLVPSSSSTSGSNGDNVSCQVEDGGRRGNCGRREAEGGQVNSMVDEGVGRVRENGRGARAGDGEASVASAAPVCARDGVGSRIVSPLNRTTTNRCSNGCSREDTATSTDGGTMERVGSSKKGGSRLVQGGACDETWNPIAESMNYEGCYMPKGMACDVRFSYASSSSTVARRLEELHREKEAFRRVMTGEE